VLGNKNEPEVPRTFRIARKAKLSLKRNDFMPNTDRGRQTTYYGL